MYACVIILYTQSYIQRSPFILVCGISDSDITCLTILTLPNTILCGHDSVMTQGYELNRDLCIIYFITWFIAKCLALNLLVGYWIYIHTYSTKILVDQIKCHPVFTDYISGFHIFLLKF